MPSAWRPTLGHCGGEVGGWGWQILTGLIAKIIIDGGTILPLGLGRLINSLWEVDLGIRSPSHPPSGEPIW